MIWSDFLVVTKNWDERPAVICNEGTLSYGDLIERVQSAVLALPPPRGCKPERVILLETDPLPLLLKTLACWSVGRVPVILREGRNAASVQNIKDYISSDTTGSTEGLNREGAGKGQPEKLSPRDEALVICTSGTTQLPKLVALPAEAVLINAKQIGLSLGFQPGDLIAVSTPLTYMYGLMGASISALWAGATIRLFRATEPPTAIQAAIRSEGVTVLQGPPSLMRLFLAYWNGKPFPSVRLVTTGGELVDSDLVASLYEAFPECEIQKLFGMTEAGPRISHKRLDRKIKIDSGVGIPFTHLDWYVEPLNEPSDHLRLPPGVGRLVIRGPTVFLGYISRNGSYEGLEPDGYFRSNDMVIIDPTGELKYVDRMDRMFKCGGKLVNPTEVETVLLQHGSVQEARCKKEPHSFLGFIPVAEIVQHEGATGTLEDLSKHCRLSLQKHSVPRRFDYKESISLAPSGKRL